MAETSVTDFFTLPEFGRVSGSTNARTRPCLKSGQDDYDSGRRSIIFHPVHTEVNI